jgi:hypothetical protein
MSNSPALNPESLLEETRELRRKLYRMRISAHRDHEDRRIVISQIGPS